MWLSSSTTKRIPSGNLPAKAVSGPAGQRNARPHRGIVDYNYNRFHDERMGIWGFFECADDLEAAAALMGAVEDMAPGSGNGFFTGPLKSFHQL